MIEKIVRFGITDGLGNRSATWRCFSHIGYGIQSVYLTCREIKGNIKASHHKPDVWLVGFDNDTEFYKNNIDQFKNGRMFAKGHRPKEITSEISLPWRIVTPWASVNVPIKQSEDKKINWIQNAPDGSATEISFLFITKNIQDVILPEGVYPVAKLSLDSNESVLIVRRVVEMPDLSSLVKGTPKFFAKKSLKDMKGNGLRMMLFGHEDLGPLIIYDCVVRFGKNKESMESMKSMGSE